MCSLFLCEWDRYFFAPQAEGDTAGKRMCAGGLPICRTIRVARVLEGRACLSGNDAACGAIGSATGEQSTCAG